MSDKRTDDPREAATRLAALLNKIEQGGLEVYTIGSSVVVSGVKVVEGNRVGQPWTVESDEPAPQFRVTVESPHRYLRSPTGVLHLRSEGGVIEEDGLSSSRARCGWESDCDAIAEKVSAHARVCRRCVVSEP